LYRIVSLNLLTACTLGRYNTYDVHFYAGFALLMLWPQLELSLQRDFAAAVSAEDLSERTMLGEGGKRPRKVVGCIPHDLGSPSEDPFRKTNIYNFQDVSLWKDLPSKFVLQIYRNFKYTKALGFLQDMYPVVVRVMEQALLFDRDGDGMIENEGFPDQTYDIWTASGVHAYCGGLWTAACFAAAEMAKLMGDLPTHVRFMETGDSARQVFQLKLWNGVYFDYDSSKSGHHDSVMADMLAGQWYCRVCELPPIASVAQALSCFRTIYKLNVIKFGQGERLMGAVNGMRPDGSIDRCCLQSREVWTGTTYALASAMLLEAGVVEVSLGAEDMVADDEVHEHEDTHEDDAHHSHSDVEGSAPATAASEEHASTHLPADLDFQFDETLNIGFGKDERKRRKKHFMKMKNPLKRHNKEEEPKVNIKDQLSTSSGRREVIDELRKMGFDTAQGIHDGGWKQFGYWFATPEGWEVTGNYRSLGYMRPLAIWAMQFSSEMKINADKKS
jgi:hypothetical protein